MHGTLVTTLAVGEILVVTGVTPADRLLTKAMPPVGKAFVTQHVTNYWRKSKASGGS